MNRVFKKVILRIFIALIALGLLAVPALYLIALNSPTVSAAWFNDSWAYRQKIPINTHTASETNVYNEITVDTASLTTDKLQADCDDLRFTKLNGEILPYQIVSGCDSATTTIRVGFDTMPAAPFDVYMYYGNPSASTGSQTLTHSACGNGCAEGSFATEEKAPSPAAYWKFDDSQGQTAQDSTINNNDGTLGATSAVSSDDPTWQTEDMCVAGKCLKFDGGDEVTTSMRYTATSAHSISVWIKPQAKIIDGLPNQVIYYGNYVAYSPNYHWDGIFVNNAGTQVSVAQYDGTDALVNIPVTPNQWVNIVYTHDGTTLRGYKNGIYIGSVGARNPNINSSATVVIGGLQSHTNDRYQGFIDEVKIYPYARSAAQILADYNSRGNNEGVSFSQGDALSTQGVPLKALSNGLVGYWKMDEASANSCTGGVNDNCDSSGNGNDGAWNGDATSAAGKYGNGTTFDGTGDYVEVPNSSTLHPRPSLTLSAWVNLSAMPSDYSFILSDDSGSNRSFVWGVRYSKPFFSAIGKADYISNNSASTTLTTNTWYHLVVTYDGTSYREYTNGALGATVAGNIPNNSSGPLDIGVRVTNDGPFNGKIDDLRIYNRALSPAEVSALYNFAPGPVGYWKMDDASWNGTSGEVKDSSGNGNNGTGSGGVTTANTGKYGKAGNFGGNTPAHQVNVSDSTSLRPNILTASAWIKLPNSATGSYQAVLNKHNVLGFYTTYGVWINPSGKIYAEFRGTSNTSNNQVSSSSIVSNTWTHIAVTMTDTNMNFYINGVLDVARTYSSVIPTYDTQNLYIGWDGCCSTQYFNGQIDEVKFYNYARTQKQIIEDMGGGHPAVLAGTSGPSTSSGRSGGPIGYWKFDEGYGTTAHNSGSQGETLQGSLSGFASPATTTSGWTQAGKFNRGLVFDGTDDVVSVTRNSSIEPPTAITVSLWIKTSSSNEVALDKSYSPNVSDSYQIYINTSGHFRWGIYNGSFQTLTNTAISVNNGQWHHLVGTYDGSTMKEYVDGILQTTTASVTGNIVYNTTKNLYLGYNSPNGAGYYFNGSIDEVKIYPYALTADEVKLDYNRGAAQVLGALSDTNSLNTSQPNSAASEYCVPGDTTSTSCAAPVGRWDFDEGTGNSVNDKSGNNNIGTWNGTLGNQWKTGKIGKAGNFNGSDNQVQISNASSLQLTGDLSIELWVKPSSTQVVNASILRKESSGDGYGIEMDENSNSNTYYFGWKNGGTAYCWSSNSFSLTPNQWQHLVIQKSGATRKVFVNGVENTAASCTAASGTISTSGASLILGFSINTRYFNGLIDSVRIFNYARSGAQIAWDYNRGAPVAHYKMDECQGATAHDSSGNSNHGTINLSTTGTQTTALGMGTCTTNASTPWYNGRTGKFNSSLNFDGSDDYVSTANNLGISGDAAFTIEAWVYWDADTCPTDYQTIFSTTQTGVTNRSLILTMGNTACRVTLDYWNTRWRITNGLNVRQWYHIAGVKTPGLISTTSKVYINGVEVAGAAESDTTPNIIDAAPVIGRLGATRYFDGLIDDVKVFNYALTATQIKLLYNQGGAIRYGPLTGVP